MQKGDAFDIASVMCSVLIGSGYDAYVVHGRAAMKIASNDHSQQPCPKTLEKIDTPCPSSSPEKQNAGKTGHRLGQPTGTNASCEGGLTQMLEGSKALQALRAEGEEAGLAHEGRERASESGVETAAAEAAKEDSGGKNEETHSTADGLAASADANAPAPSSGGTSEQTLAAQCSSPLKESKEVQPSTAESAHPGSASETPTTGLAAPTLHGQILKANEEGAVDKASNPEVSQAATPPQGSATGSGSVHAWVLIKADAKVYYQIIGTLLSE